MDFPARHPLAAGRGARRCGAALASLWVALWAVALLAAPPARAQAEAGRLVLDAAQLWEFAESLYRGGEYYRAVSEYQRLLHFFPASPQAPEAALRIAQAQLRGGEPARAIAHLSALRRTNIEGGGGHPEKADELRYWLGLAWLERNGDRPYPLRLAGIATALEELRAIAPEWRDAQRVAGFVAAMDAPPELPEKSPWLAGTFSAIVPGSGSLYVGRYAEGALGFFLTGLFAYAAVTSFERDQVAAGTVFAALGLAFYGGSIWAAAGGAHKHNDRARAAYLAEQRRRFGLIVSGNRVGAAFERGF